MKDHNRQPSPFQPQQTSRNILKSENGQTLVEYALLLVLVAFVTVTAMQSLGISVSNSFTRIDNALSAAMTGNSSGNSVSNDNINGSGNSNGHGNSNSNGNDNNGKGVGKSGN